jgi:hypothetical protein
MTFNMQRVKNALPEEGPKGRRGVLRNRADVGEIVCDIVLGRRTMVDISKRTDLEYSTVQRFKEKYITDAVVKVIMAENERAASASDDAVINKGQDDVQQGLRGIIKEQRDIYRMIKEKIADGRDVEDLAPALGQLLRDQGQSFERLLKSYTALKDKTTVVLSINESPEWSRLQEALFTVFERHPDAFATFQQEVAERRLNVVPS